MDRRTAKLIRLVAKTTGAPYRGLKKAFYGLSQKDKSKARIEMKEAYHKAKQESELTMEDERKEWDNLLNELETKRIET